MTIRERLRQATTGGTTCVYAYLRSSNRTPYYIGVSTGMSRALCQHGHRKHGISVPTDRRFVVILRSNLTKQQAAQWEMFYIRRYGRINLGTGILRNSSDGGEGLQNPTRETRAKISAFMRTRPVSAAQIESIRSIGRRPKSSETKRLMSESQKGRKMTPTQLANFRLAMDARIARNAAFAGMTVEEHKAQVKRTALAKERERKSAIRAEAASLGMSKRSYDQWVLDGKPSDISSYLKPVRVPVPGIDGLSDQEKRRAERNHVGLSERQYRLWVKDGRPLNIDHYRTIYGKPGRRPKSLIAPLAA